MYPDTEAYNKSFRTRTVPRGPGCPDSTCHDWDWLRAVVGDPFMSDSVRRCTPGTFTGKWRGTEIVRVGCGTALVCRSDANRTGSVQPRLYAVHDRQAGPSDLAGRSMCDTPRSARSRSTLATCHSSRPMQTHALEPDASSEPLTAHRRRWNEHVM